MLAVALPLGALAWVERRSDRLRAILGLEDPGLKAKVPIVASLVAIPLLLSVALAQPVIRYTGEHSVRTDAELYYVFDVEPLDVRRAVARVPTPLRPGARDRGADSPAAARTSRPASRR